MNRRDCLATIGTLVASSALGTRFALAQSSGAPMNPTVASPSFGPAVNGLSLGLQWLNNFTVAFVLRNDSSAPITVLSHVVAGRTNLDWYDLRLESATHNAPARVLHFSEPRNRSGRVTAIIAPGATLVHQVDTREWAHSSSNPVAPDWHTSPTYLLTASYDTTQESAVWRGRLISGTLATWIETN